MAEAAVGGGGEEAKETQHIRPNAPGPSYKLFLSSRGQCWQQKAERE